MVATVLALFLFAELAAMPSLKNVINNPEINSISQTRDIPELDGIPFYYNSENPLRIEIVYAAGRVNQAIKGFRQGFASAEIAVRCHHT